MLTSGNSPYLWCGKEYESFIDIPWYDSEARFLTTNGIFTSTDPFSEKYYHISPYAYCAGDPVNKVDPEGMWLETLWDVANIIIDAESFTKNIKEGNVGAAIVDGVSIVVDAAAVVLPLVPGGAGTVVKAARAADKAADAANTAKRVEAMKRGLVNEAKTLDAIGETKNTKSFTIPLEDGTVKTTIPDYVNSTTIGEIKDTKVVNNTIQIRAQIELAKNTGRDYKLFVGKQTVVSKKIPDEYIIRLDWLGPQ